MKAGIIDPTKVVRSALQNAASVAGLLVDDRMHGGREPGGDAGRSTRRIQGGMHPEMT